MKINKLADDWIVDDFTPISTAIKNGDIIMKEENDEQSDEQSNEHPNHKRQQQTDQG